MEAMADQVIHTLDTKRLEIEAHIGSLEQDLEQARRDLSAILAAIKVFSAEGPRVTAYMNLSRLFPRIGNVFRRHCFHSGCISCGCASDTKCPIAHVTMYPPPCRYPSPFCVAPTTLAMSRATDGFSATTAMLDKLPAYCSEPRPALLTGVPFAHPLATTQPTLLNRHSHIRLPNGRSDSDYNRQIPGCDVRG